MERRIDTFANCKDCGILSDVVKYEWLCGDCLWEKQCKTPGFMDIYARELELNKRLQQEDEANDDGLEEYLRDKYDK